MKLILPQAALDLFLRQCGDLLIVFDQVLDFSRQQLQPAFPK